MNVLIVEDSLTLINIYSETIEKTLKKFKKYEKPTIIGVVDYEQYLFFKNMKFDLAIFDWNIINGTSKPIVDDLYNNNDLKYSAFITGYAMNKEVNFLSHKYDIPIISKPTSEIEIKEMLYDAIKLIYTNEYSYHTVI